jgi:glycerophosphoryl diester phosphodiesterase
LEDVLRQFAHRAFLDIELKVAGLEPQTLAELRKHPPQKGYVVSSFLPEALTAIYGLEPAIPLGFLCETRDQLRGWRETPAKWLIPQFALADAELVEVVHGAGKKIMVWTVNGAERMRGFAEWRTDAIITDETELLVRSLR